MLLLCEPQELLFFAFANCSPAHSLALSRPQAEPPPPLTRNAPQSRAVRHLFVFSLLTGTTQQSFVPIIQQRDGGQAGQAREQLQSHTPCTPGNCPHPRETEGSFIPRPLRGCGTTSTAITQPLTAGGMGSGPGFGVGEGDGGNSELAFQE